MINNGLGRHVAGTEDHLIDIINIYHLVHLFDRPKVAFLFGFFILQGDQAQERHVAALPQHMYDPRGLLAVTRNEHAFLFCLPRTKGFVPDQGVEGPGYDHTEQGPNAAQQDQRPGEPQMGWEEGIDHQDRNGTPADTSYNTIQAGGRIVTSAEIRSR